MRIRSFELDCAFNPCFVLAEIANGQARLLRFVRIQNVRGTGANWLRLCAEVDGKRIRQKSIRELVPGDDARAVQLERDVRDALIAPKGLSPGHHTGLIRVYDDEDGESELSFDFEVLDEHIIPTDFVRSPLLASYISEDDRLRGFASDALAGASSPGADTLRGLYEALLARQLSYQPPVNTRYPDCQRTSDMRYVLERGGSCADLSLLMASLLWCRSESPALLLFPDHMAAGRFTGEALPDFDTLEGAGNILKMVESGALELVEVTALCGYRQDGFKQAQSRILDRLASSDQPCQLVNVTRVLRSGAVTLLSRQERAYRCPHCGFDRLTAEQAVAGALCPACGMPFPDQMETPSEPAPEVENDGLIQYAMIRDVAVAKRLQDPRAERVRVASVWHGHVVRHISERAFERSGIRQAALPDSISRVGDYAFYGCRALESLRLPEGLREIGAGAFCGSGLKQIHIPGSVERISRQAFSGCVSLEHVELGDDIRFIDMRAFADCARLRSVRIPASVERIARNAFDPGCELMLVSGKTIVEN